MIGNGAYAHAVTLPNPPADGKLIADTLRSAGFSVIEGSDLDKAEMTKLLDQFTEAAYDADIALVFYAGHGLQVDGRNYLIPVDAELEKAAQLQTRTIPVEAVLAALPPDPAVGVIILDACRDNPLARTLARALPVSRSSSIGAGLAPVQANGQSTNAGGLLIAYATDPGAVAYDGKDAHSPYTTALARHLATPGLEIQSALTRVRAEVSRNHRRRPAPLAQRLAGARGVHRRRSHRLPSQLPPRKPPPARPRSSSAKPAAGADVDWTVEQKLWDEASKRNTVAHYELYLSQYPEGRFAGVARLNLDQLKADRGRSCRQIQLPTAEPDGEDGLGLANAARPSGSRTRSSWTPGTPATEAQLNLNRDSLIDLQLRLSALGIRHGRLRRLARPALARGNRRMAAPEWHRRDNLPDAAAAYVPGRARPTR